MKKQDFNLQKFATRFSELLEETNENTYSLAKKLGLTPATISRYANGIMAPKLPTLYAIADIFEVNPIWLFGYDAEKYVHKNTSNDEIVLSEHEKNLIIAYRNKPEMQSSVDKLLDVPSSVSSQNTNDIVDDAINEMHSTPKNINVK